ncbi:guanine deaminase [Notoacmeibacter sp. MSK16QG-6]|uniref:guanine deaminase n=1 Tax=Notoacmeibacter sp. MSK16QG-6 TaxID=2957982 RepID=UPI00209E26B1|nr:guanine deaminase [Notoacmeibacter sp. MSK16QG-6]MCP1200290.1 guanine deaminase [Notoacmeibacter sp. MSK16QG-6]
MKDFRGKTIRASGFHAPVCGEIVSFADALIAISNDGLIESVYQAGDSAYDQTLSAAKGDGRLIDLPAGKILLPGFVDLHIHAPQYPQLGTALDVPLEIWLQNHTFPLEARYADLAFARRSYSMLVDDLLASGTTTAVYYGTIHDEANRLLADLCIEKGQRAFVGKVAMDNPAECPDYYRDESIDAALKATTGLIDHIRGHPDNEDGLVRPIVTPRFIPSCTDDLLTELGALAKEHDCHTQTHCSESDWEHGYVIDRHGMSDTESLDRFGLLRAGTILAHGNFLFSNDMEVIKMRQSAVAHCPLSNIYFSDAVFPLKAALQKGLRVGLGTDISGGPSCSMFDSVRSTVSSARQLERGTDPSLSRDKRSTQGDVRIDFREAFHLATAGGGAAVGLPVGAFAPGYQFDAILIDPEAKSGTIRLWPELYEGDQILQTILFTASRANIASVWVGGKHRSGDPDRQ